MIKERIGAVAVFHAKNFHFPGLLRMNLKDIYPGNMEKLENWALFKFWDDEKKKSFLKISSECFKMYLMDVSHKNQIYHAIVCQGSDWISIGLFCFFLPRLLNCIVTPSSEFAVKTCRRITKIIIADEFLRLGFFMFANICFNLSPSNYLKIFFTLFTSLQIIFIKIS